MKNRWKALTALAVAASLVAAPLVASAASATGGGYPPEVCIPSDAWDETVIVTPAIPAVPEVAEVAHTEYQRYSWVGGPLDGAPPSTPPGADWQANTTNYEGAGHGTDPIGVAFDESHGSSGNADWFFWTATRVIDQPYVPGTPEVPAVTRVVHHDAVTCPPDEPTTTSLNPPVVKDLCDTENDHYGLPEGSAGVTYSRDGLDIIATLAEGYAVSLVPEGWTAEGEGVYRFAFDGEAFTDEPCVTTVPVPALFAAEPEPPTCDTAGSFDFSTDPTPNLDVTVEPEYTGPGTYVVTATALNGATFEDGTTVITRTITVEGALGFQSTDPEADCYLDAPEPITLGQPSVVDNCGTSSDGGLLPPEQTGVTYAWEDESDPDNWTIIATVAEGYVVSDASAGWVEGDGVYVLEWAPTFTDEACPTYPPTEPPTTPGKTTTPPALAVTGNGTNWMPWTLGALAMMLAGASAMGFRKVFNR